MNIDVIILNILMTGIIVILMRFIIRERSSYKFRKRMNECENELKSELYHKFKNNEFQDEQVMHKYLKEKFRYYKGLVKNDNN